MVEAVVPVAAEAVPPNSLAVVVNPLAVVTEAPVEANPLATETVWVGEKKVECSQVCLKKVDLEIQIYIGI